VCPLVFSLLSFFFLKKRRELLLNLVFSVFRRVFSFEKFNFKLCVRCDVPGLVGGRYLFMVKCLVLIFFF